MGSTSSGLGRSVRSGSGPAIAEDALVGVDRLVGLASILGERDGAILGGLGEGIGPTITLGGGAFGAGAGMYGCLRPPESDIVGTFLVEEEGVRIPFDSLISWGLSSHMEEGGFGGLG